MGVHLCIMKELTVYCIPIADSVLPSGCPIYYYWIQVSKIPLLFLVLSVVQPKYAASSFNHVYLIKSAMQIARSFRWQLSFMSTFPSPIHDNTFSLTSIFLKTNMTAFCFFCRDDAGRLVRTERLRTKDITQRVKMKNYWQVKSLMRYPVLTMKFLTFTVESLYVVSFTFLLWTVYMLSH